jgi:hypothetical protein
MGMVRREHHASGLLPSHHSDEEHAHMTDAEVKPWVGKPIRLTLDDGQVLAGTLHADDAHGHGHHHYSVVSSPVRSGGEKASVMIHGAERITQIEDASGDPAAVE